MRKVLLPTLLLLAAYLSVVAAWSWLAFDGALRHVEPVHDAGLSARQIEILLQVEDPDFFEHAGLSLREGQGFTTLTSVVAREVYLGEAQLDGVSGLLQGALRAVFSCCKRVDIGRDVMALVLNQKLPKVQQLEVYAARVYLGTLNGRQVIGFQQAAHAYFGKPLAELTEHEFTGLVAMIKAPNTYHPLRHPDLYAQRLARVSALVAGHCHPGGWFDTTLEHC